MGVRNMEQFYHIDFSSSYLITFSKISLKQNAANLDLSGRTVGLQTVSKNLQPHKVSHCTSLLEAILSN